MKLNHLAIKSKTSNTETAEGDYASFGCLLASEDAAKFERFHRERYEHFAPTDPDQIDLVERIIGYKWRLNRLAKLESEALEIRSNEEEDLFSLSHQEEKFLQNLDKREKHLLKAEADARKQLAALKKEERQNEPKKEEEKRVSESPDRRLMSEDPESYLLESTSDSDPTRWTPMPEDLRNATLHKASQNPEGELAQTLAAIRRIKPETAHLDPVQVWTALLQDQPLFTQYQTREKVKPRK